MKIVVFTVFFLKKKKKNGSKANTMIYLPWLGERIHLLWLLYKLL